jgi:hypothetical protein
MVCIRSGAKFAIRAAKYPICFIQTLPAFHHVFAERIPAGFFCEMEGIPGNSGRAVLNFDRGIPVLGPSTDRKVVFRRPWMGFKKPLEGALHGQRHRLAPWGGLSFSRKCQDNHKRWGFVFAGMRVLTLPRSCKAGIPGSLPASGCTVPRRRRWEEDWSGH